MGLRSQASPVGSRVWSLVVAIALFFQRLAVLPKARSSDGLGLCVLLRLSFIYPSCE